MSTREAQWVWEVRLACKHSFGGRGGTQTKDYVKGHTEFICPQCDVPQDVKYFAARGA